jgi:enoyl-CoA hydratase/3-hydroxyacyl-CoA dehydrogenase
VIGGGLMGSGIATALILSGVKVYLKEINSEFLQAGIQRIEENLKSRVAKGGMTQAKLQKILGLVKGILDYEDCNDVDIVIEAAVEDILLKQRIFADLEKYCKPTCLLASNTSTIDIGVIGANTKSQDRIIGAHFFRCIIPELAVNGTFSCSFVNCGTFQDECHPIWWTILI